MPSKPASHSSLSAKLAPIRLRALFRRFFLSLTLASLLPFTVVGVGAALVFGGILYQKSEEHQHALVESHAAIVRLFLAERQKALTLLSSTTSRDDVTQEGRISQLLEQLNRAYPGSFQDLGVIDRDGRHLAYAGPYELLDKNYAEAPWFREVTEKGVYTSDVFMGFRKVPHFVMAVKHQEADGYWILRASIDSAIFGAACRRWSAQTRWRLLPSGHARSLPDRSAKRGGPAFRKRIDRVRALSGRENRPVPDGRTNVHASRIAMDRRAAMALGGAAVGRLLHEARPRSHGTWHGCLCRWSLHHHGRHILLDTLLGAFGPAGNCRTRLGQSAVSSSGEVGQYRRIGYGTCP